MIVSIQIEEETVKALQARADARGITVADYLQSIADSDEANSRPAINRDMASALEFDGLLDDLFATDPRKLPSLPPDFSRSDLYTQHD